jgi:cytoskeleton protein RodZ
MRMDKLPSRTFTIGYVRAYAAALGLDPEAAAARFRRDVPGEDDTLRPPVGVSRQGDPRLAVICICGAVVAAGVLLWNVAQRAAMGDSSLRAGVVPLAQSLAAPPRGPVMLGAPTQAPIESTTPKPDITPGMPPASDAAPIVGDPADEAIAEAAASPPSTFTPRGTVYGTAPDPSAIILQANKTALVVIHGADGSVYFARQLRAGEAYRISDAQGLTADVSDPAAFDVFVAGAFKGPLPAAQTPLSKLVG